MSIQKLNFMAYSISADEEIVIDAYRKLDKEGRNVIIFLLDSEVRRVTRIRELESDQEPETDWVILPRSLQKVSAGTGCYLGPEEFEQVKIKSTPLTRRASFLVEVAGDSMFPLYRDGDLLIIERAEDINPGEVGIFTVNGDGFVKKRGDGELISLNPDFKNIPITEDSWCNGRVIGVALQADLF